MMTKVRQPLAPDTQQVSSRYEIHELLGRGGMACVYRASDRSLGRDVALKQLVVSPTAPERASIAALFEREFHILMQLRHPHVIAVHDYGVSAEGAPFYTMELLDGGDLRERAPISWRETCRLVFDVCSALALLHSRRLLHRDISPRNIRCTLDGQAKLIDFGAMVQMSTGGAEVVGTPAFTAPETLQRLALDARTDLYSLGVTLYYALTTRLPYSARTFSDLLLAWGGKPVRPSAFVPDIPPALDDLVLSLIAVEPALRPHSAFDVMQQLAACAGLHAAESVDVSRAYLATPTLVGREAALARLQEMLRDSRLQRVSGVMIEGPPGAGRSRLLDACALEAQTRGFAVLRATATGAREPFAVARSLASHLLDSLPFGHTSADYRELFTSTASAPANDTKSDAPAARPVLRSFADAALDPAELQGALRRWILNVSRTHPLLLAVDDVHRIDQPSAALLAELIDKSKRGGILVALTADSEDERDDALKALARRCTPMPLAPLTGEQTRELFGSLFGDVANLSMLSEEVQRVALGNPRQSLELAQHLVERGLIRYASGSWTLPSRVSADDLPRTAGAALQARIARMSPHARFLAEAQALAFFETFADEDYRALLPDVGSQEVELALSELLAAQAVVRDGAVYLLANRVWTAAFLAELEPARIQRVHRALAAMYAAKLSLAFVHHAFSGGLDQQALEALDQRNDVYKVAADFTKLLDQNVGKLMWCYPRAIETALALGRSARDVHDLRRWQYLGTLVTNDAPEPVSARLLIEQLAHDTGLTLYRSDTTSATPGERLTRALQTAVERYLATPEHDRVMPVDEAIRKLAEYVVVSMGIGGRSLDIDLIRSLPDLIEPFVALSPLLAVIWKNSLASRVGHCECRYELARDLWREALTMIDTLPASDEAHFVVAMSNAIAHAIGTMEAQLGLESAASWATRLDHDPFQRVSALNLRKIVRLEQGDAQGADRLRRQAEVLALQMRTPPMFKSLLILELAAYSMSRDLAGIARVIEEMRPLAASYPGWRFNLISGEATFDLVRGDYEAALKKFEQASELTRLDEQGNSRHLAVWIGAQAGATECLLALGHDERASRTASAALAVCEARGLGVITFDLIRALAVAEAKLGDAARGAARLDALIARQLETGATGLRLGLSYESRARLAIWSGDAPAFEQFSELTAQQYRHAAHTPLAARYERLLNDAARRGMRATASLPNFESLAGGDTSSVDNGQLFTIITRSMSEAPSSDGRTQLALQMICAAHGSSVGHLYLITPAGLLLCASRGAEVPALELAHRAASYVAEQVSHAEGLDDMVTGDLPDDAVLTALFDAAGQSYELLPLGCVIEATTMLAGVAVIRVAEAGERVRNDKQAQLRSALAANLLQTGDSTGIRLSAAD
jgi:hypothetical protein